MRIRKEQGKEGVGHCQIKIKNNTFLSAWGKNRKAFKTRIQEAIRQDLKLVSRDRAQEIERLSQHLWVIERSKDNVTLGSSTVACLLGGMAGGINSISYL